MDRITINKVVEINCLKLFETPTCKSVINNYKQFVDKVNDEYLLNITKELSEFNTPVISIFDKKQKNIPSCYLWCFNDLYYLKTPTVINITTDLSEVLCNIDNYFYK